MLYQQEAAARSRLADAEARLRRHQAAIAAGVDPAALVEPINQAQAERVAAQAELANTPVSQRLTAADVHDMIDSLGDVAAMLSEAPSESLTRLYQELRLELRYQPHEAAVEVTATPRVVSERVRGGT